MNRSLFISIHLYLSSFFAAVVVLVAFSGGMYLLGVKGSLETTEVAQIKGGAALMADPSKEAVLTALDGAGIAIAKGRVELDPDMADLGVCEVEFVRSFAGDGAAQH
ncbi:MAG: hypothetical protein NWQ45_15250, partial [Congregibacter sp.]|nr:hypothetical protein [Congregibacter sp.]